MEHPAAVASYLARLCGETRRSHICRATDPTGFALWQRRARTVLQDLLGLDRVAAGAEGHVPEASVEEEDVDAGRMGATQQR